MQSVTDTLNDAFGQRQISTIYGQANQYRVILEAQPRYQQDPNSLSKLYVTGASTSNGTAATVSTTATGTTNTNTTATPNAVTSSNQVPLAAFASFVPTSAPLAIAHQEQFPSVTISFDLNDGYALSDAVTAIRRVEREIGMPSSVTGSYSGDAAEFAKSLAGEPWLILAAAIAIYIVLGVLYESFIHPLTILSTLPSAGVGALLALMLFGYDLSVIALIGIVLLMGIVKKNAILMIDFALEAERHEGLSPEQSIVKAALVALPPDHDDDACGSVRRAAAGARRRHRLGTAQPARRHHCRRPAVVAIAHALHHARHLSLHGAPARATGADGSTGATPDSSPGPGANVNFSAPFIRRPIGTTLLAIGLFLIGAVAYAFLPVASLPNVEFPTIFVTASRPGADPNIMAATVAAPIERRLGEISGVTELTSVTSLGQSRITVQFDLSRSVDGAARDVQAALNAALSDLPGDLPTLPTFRKANPSAAPILILALTSKTMQPSAIYDAADSVIAQRLSQVDGVADVTVAGSEQPAIRVRVDPARLSAMGLSMEDVRTAISNANAAGPIGTFDGSKRAVTIGINDQLRDANEYDPLVVKTANGTVIRLSNIASIRASVRNSRAAGWFNNDPSVLLIITKQGNANVIDTVDRIYALLPELRQWVPAGLDISVLTDRTQTIRASVHDMQLTLGATVVLVMMVVFLFLRRVAPTAAAGVTVPARAVRHLRGDVGGRIFDRQSFTDGAGGERRLRRRRRHRHDRKRIPPSRAWRFAVAGNPAGCTANRLHRGVDFGVADRRLHSAAVHGRHCRAPVPRILGDARLCHRHLDRGVAVGHADDLRLFRA